jgi:beta-glucosidase/6-phospho-beta-glucosidase/beta-galactosidase|tara:strand:- start:216 stop:563 length:348 start_codon:yes stop_codon:yes gene_type:complete
MPDDKKPDYFDGIRSHFEETEIRVIEVPEWGLVGDKAIYAKPFNMMEKSKLFKGANNNDLNILIDVIIEKALDKDHNKMFDATHILSFKTKADTDVIARVSNQILGTNFDDVKKN